MCITVSKGFLPITDTRRLNNTTEQLCCILNIFYFLLISLSFVLSFPKLQSCHVIQCLFPQKIKWLLSDLISFQCMIPLLTQTEQLSVVFSIFYFSLPSGFKSFFFSPFPQLYSYLVIKCLFPQNIEWLLSLSTNFMLVYGFNYLIKFTTSSFFKSLTKFLIDKRH